MADILIEHGTIITMNKNREIIEDGAVAIQAKRIVAVGKTDAIRKQYRFESRIDAKRNPVLPGLVNTHTHFFQTLYKSLSDDLALVEWLPNIYKLSVNIRPDDCYYAALIGCIELIRTGCTCVLDENYPYAGKTSESVLKAFDKIGIRGTVARGLFDRDLWNLGTPFVEDTDKQVNDTVALIEKWRRNDRVRVWFSPNWASYCSDELVAKASEAAEQQRVGVSMHLHEAEEEVQRWKKLTGYSPIQYYHSKGVKLLNPNLIAVHCVWLDDIDIRILKETGANVSHNPVSNMYLASGISPIPKMLKAGIPIGLGTDGAASNNCQDMIEVMKTTALLHKVATLDPLSIGAEKVLEMATIDGAKAMGLENEIGSIEPGKRADLVVFDLKHANTTPINRPHSQIVYCSKSHNVDTVIIDGKIVMKKGRITTLDEEKIVKKTQEVADDLIERSDVKRFRRGWSKQEK